MYILEHVENREELSHVMEEKPNQRGRKKNVEELPKAEVGSWVIGYWVPEEHFEINVWNCFENRFKRILKGEEEIYELFSGKSDEYMQEYANQRYSRLQKNIKL